MVNVELLKDTIIVSRHKTIQEVYTQMGLTKRKWGIRIEKRKFDSDEIAALINILSLTWEEVYAIFFRIEVTQHATL